MHDMMLLLLLLLLYVLVKVLLVILAIVCSVQVSLACIVILRYYIFGLSKAPRRSCLYSGRVQHTRLKGGAIHHLDYPIFFSCVDLHEMEEIGWNFWPIFIVDRKKSSNWNWNWISMFTFCRLDYYEHLKGWKEEDIVLFRRLQQFISDQTKGKVEISNDDRVSLITHLTYFGYCFNPVSFYYVFKSTSENSNTSSTMAGSKKNDDLSLIVTEVSNTPWIEQHSYVLHESVSNVIIKRDQEKNIFDATWNKEFHVSPFMEMDYNYNFIFSYPTEKVIVYSKMFKRSTNEVWFTANFNLNRMEFTPFNLLYVLLFYPLHTRVIQVWIHIEAVKLWWKGVPTFSHPKGSVIEFGFGITDRTLLNLYLSFIKVMKSFGGAGSAKITKTVTKKQNLQE